MKRAKVEMQSYSKRKVEKMNSIVKHLAVMTIAFLTLAVNSFAAPPIITSTTVSADNSKVSVTFDQPVYSNTVINVSTVAGTTEGFSDGPSGSAQFSSPAGIALDSAGNIYVADWGNHKIRKIANDILSDCKSF